MNSVNLMEELYKISWNGSYKNKNTLVMLEKKSPTAGMNGARTHYRVFLATAGNDSHIFRSYYLGQVICFPRL